MQQFSFGLTGPMDNSSHMLFQNIPQLPPPQIPQQPQPPQNPVPSVMNVPSYSEPRPRATNKRKKTIRTRHRFIFIKHQLALIMKEIGITSCSCGSCGGNSLEHLGLLNNLGTGYGTSDGGGKHFDSSSDNSSSPIPINQKLMFYSKFFRGRGRGRPKLIGDELDASLIEHLINVKKFYPNEHVTASQVIEVARQFISQKAPEILKENGGHVQLKIPWAINLLGRIGDREKEIELGLPAGSLALTKMNNLDDELEFCDPMQSKMNGADDGSTKYIDLDESHNEWNIDILHKKFVLIQHQLDRLMKHLSIEVCTCETCSMVNKSEEQHQTDPQYPPHTKSESKNVPKSGRSRGRPKLIGEQLDAELLEHIANIKNNSPRSHLTPSQVLGFAKQYINQRSPGLLRENGGTIDLKIQWAMHLLGRIEDRKRDVFRKMELLSNKISNVKPDIRAINEINGNFNVIQHQLSRIMKHLDVPNCYCSLCSSSENGSQDNYSHMNGTGELKTESVDNDDMDVKDVTKDAFANLFSSSQYATNFDIPSPGTSTSGMDSPNNSQLMKTMLDMVNASGSSSGMRGRGRGRPKLIGDELDADLVEHMVKIKKTFPRQHFTPSQATHVAKEYINEKAPGLLEENGGHVKLKLQWVIKLINRIRDREREIELGLPAGSLTGRRFCQSTSDNDEPLE